jgi:hypothetical protein
VQVVANVPWAGPVPDQGSDSRGERIVNLLWADEMDVSVDSSRRKDVAFSGNHLRPRSDDDGDPWLNVRVSRFADRGDSAVLDPDIRFQDPAVIDNNSIGDHGVDGFLGGSLGLAHPISDYFATPKFYFFSVNRRVLLYLDKQLRVGQAHSITGGWPEHLGVGVARDFHS